MATLAVMAMMYVAASPAVPCDEADHRNETARRERPAQDLLWRAALAALDQLGLTVDSTFLQEGRIVTVFTPLVPAALERAVRREEISTVVGPVEYRYIVELGDSPERARLVVKAEIRESLSQGRWRSLTSNQTLEGDFLRSFAETLNRLGNG